MSHILTSLYLPGHQEPGGFQVLRTCILVIENCELRIPSQQGLVATLEFGEIVLDENQQPKL